MEEIKISHVPSPCPVCQGANTLFWTWTWNIWCEDCQAITSIEDDELDDDELAQKYIYKPKTWNDNDKQLELKLKL